MISLFKANYSEGFLFGFAFIIFILFPGLSWFSYFAIIISVHQFLLLFYSFGHVIPIRYLFGTLMCLQMLIGPAFAYNGLDQYQYLMYKMQVPETVYFSYAIPAVLCFILGLHISAGKLKGEGIDEKSILVFIKRHSWLPYWFIGIGFVASVISIFFSSELAFVFYLLGSFKFIGAFLLILGGIRLKVLPLIAVYGSIIISSLGQGMFHDLLTWLIMLGAVMSIKYKPSILLRAGFCLTFVLLAVLIQQLKGGYRAATGGGEEAGIETLQKVYEAGQEKNALFNFRSLASSNTRINQGFIITNIMRRVPAKVPFANGTQMRQVIEAAVLPRILAPNKLKAGDKVIFTKYSGINLRQGTSMGLSSLGDAYINFGVVGGCVFMFFLGLLYSEALNKFHKYSKYFPILLLFTPLVFYYPIRPDCELQTILGHFVKSIFLIFVVFYFWKKYFWQAPIQVEKQEPDDSVVTFKQQAIGNRQ